MEYASGSVKFTIELDTEINRFLGETGVCTNKSDVRTSLPGTRSEPVI